MASINKFTPKPYTSDGSYEDTLLKASDYCGDVDSAGGWVSATPADGVHGDPAQEYAYPSITIGGEYTINIYGNGLAGIYKNGQEIASLPGMHGQNNVIVVVYDTWFVHLLIHGCIGTEPDVASIAVCCMNIEGKRISGYRSLSHYGEGEFNSINSMSLYDSNNELYTFAKVYDYNVDRSMIDVTAQPLSYIKDSGLITCPTLPLDTAYSHKIVKFQNSEHYALGTNTLIRIKR